VSGRPAFARRCERLSGPARAHPGHDVKAPCTQHCPNPLHHRHPHSAYIISVGFLRLPCIIMPIDRGPAPAKNAVVHGAMLRLDPFWAIRAHRLCTRPLSLPSPCAMMCPFVIRSVRSCPLWLTARHIVEHGHVSPGDERPHMQRDHPPAGSQEESQLLISPARLLSILVTLQNKKTGYRQSPTARAGVGDVLLPYFFLYHTFNYCNDLFGCYSSPPVLSAHLYDKRGWGGERGERGLQQARAG
jgi:hypothetical protein